MERLVNLAETDSGFYILALHSYIENHIRSRTATYFSDDFKCLFKKWETHCCPRT